MDGFSFPSWDFSFLLGLLKSQLAKIPEQIGQWLSTACNPTAHWHRWMVMFIRMQWPWIMCWLWVNLFSSSIHYHTQSISDNWPSVPTYYVSLLIYKLLNGQMKGKKFVCICVCVVLSLCVQKQTHRAGRWGAWGKGNNMLTVTKFGYSSFLHHFFTTFFCKSDPILKFTKIHTTEALF